MNKIILFTISILLAVAVVSCGSSEDTGLDSEEVGEPVVAEDRDVDETAGEETGFGSKGAFDDESYDIVEMLTYAIQDEYFARSEYEFFINELEAGTPFTNIIKSEETHIAMLMPLFEEYGLAVPDDESDAHLISVDSITQALETCVEAEINNIAMYNLFLETELPDDIRDTFIKLRDASEKHLEAFQRKLDRTA